MGIIKNVIVAFVGKPNVGKSTLFNALQVNVQAIVTHKPQTTRNHLCAHLKLDETHHAILIDTPGFHVPSNKLDLFLNSEVKFTLKSSNVVCYILDATKEINEEDTLLINNINNFEYESKILLINKIDLAPPTVIEKLVNDINKITKFDTVLNISALKCLNIDKLLEIFKTLSIHDDIDEQLWQAPTDEFVTKEIIRQSCLENLSQEVPYGIGVMITLFKYNEEKKFLNIDADIYVEKESQKSIVIGRQGSMIKTIGTQSRVNLLEIYDCKIMLNLFVKVKDDWRENDNLIQHMGYKK